MFKGDIRLDLADLPGGSPLNWAHGICHWRSVINAAFNNTSVLRPDIKTVRGCTENHVAIECMY